MNTEVNIPLLRKAVEWAEAEAAKPQRTSAWYQPGVIENAEDIGRDCGTCYCLAGFIAATVTGEEWPDDPIGVALDALGGASIGGLFSATNSIQDVRRIAEDLAGERL
jgi:hypothetical protein